MVAAKTEEVPKPEPAGIAESRVISRPPPIVCNCSSRLLYLMSEKSGEKPLRTRAAFGIEKGEPTLVK